MASVKWVNKSVITLALTSGLVACGSDDKVPSLDQLTTTCTAPEQLNSAGNGCYNPALSNLAPSITSTNVFGLKEDVENGTEVYQAKATDENDDVLTWGLSDSQGIFQIDTHSGLISVADNTNLIASNLTDHSINIAVSDGREVASLTLKVNVEAVILEDRPSVMPASNQAVIYYQRGDKDYDGWILHAWNNENCNGYAQFDDPGGENTGTEWTIGLTPSGEDDQYGMYWLIDAKADESCLNYIIHKGNDKDPNDNDQRLTFDQSRSAFVVSGVGIFDDYKEVTTDAPFNVTNASAHWIDANTLVWNQSSSDVRLIHSSQGELDTDFVVNADNSIPLTSTQLTAEQKAKVPHLADWHAYHLEQSSEQINALLKQQLVLASFDADEPVSASFVQAAKVLDAVFTGSANDADEAQLGLHYEDATVSVAVWAPTARSLTLKVFDQDKNEVASYPMVEDANTGVWSYTGDKAQLDQQYYRFALDVYHPVSKAVESLQTTDPYSVNTSSDGRYSQFVDLTASITKPEGWDDHPVPSIDKVEDAVFLEAHLRDISATDNTTSAQNRGKYLAFTEADSDAMKYLQSMQEAGVTHLHLLPVNDLASIKEQGTFNIDDTVAQACAIQASLSFCNTAADTDTVKSVLEGFDPSTTDAAQLVDEMRGYDSFNWGYDPHHFNAVEGSYASNPEGIARIVEFRQMIQAIHQMGLRAVLDVVYNHTSASGLWDNSVLDKLVPGYYHRYNEVTGQIERSTCCENTATEHRMMGKFVVDSLVHWSRHFGFDGFRFDVMGHMPKQVILDGRDAVAAIDPDTYFYGEGWNWGEVANNRLFEQATQMNLAGSKVGTFNDRPRDAIRAAKLSQTQVSVADVDHIRLGLAGTLQHFPLEDQNGNKVLGKDFSQSAYAETPADIINYVSKHDNETLWDALQFGIEAGTANEQRVRIHNLSAAIPLLSQGMPFFQLGVDKMRSKSMHRNTYDFGDWYNFVDYTHASNNWNIGLPTPSEYGYNYAQEQVDSGHGEGWKWPEIKRLAADSDIPVSAADIDFSNAVFKEFLQIRSNSELFRLTSAQAVIERVGFHNTGAGQTAGLIVMSINDGVGVTDIDANYDAMVVVINGSASVQSHTIKTATGFELHPVQASGSDSQVQTSKFESTETQGTFTVPAHTVAVFVKPQTGAQGTGLAVDPERIASPYGDTDIYFSPLGQGEAVQMSYDDRGTYIANTSASAGEHEFNLGDMTFSDLVLTLADVDIANESVAITQGAEASFKVTLTQSGTYQMKLDVSTATPILSLTLVNAAVACEAPVSAGTAPFDIAGGGQLYIRGDHSGWAAQDAYQMTYIGDNQYQAIADFDGNFQFKLASDDGNWETQLWVQNPDGSINTSELALGQQHPVAYGNAGTSNNAMNLSAGTYSFTLSLNQDNPAKETKPAGQLIVQQCTAE